MRNVAAYLLLNLAGNEQPSAQDIKKVLSSVGIESDAERVEKLVAELSGKNVQDIIAEGMKKFASMPSGGAAVSAAPAAAKVDAKAGKEEKKKEEVKEESDEEMGFGLFD